MFISILGRQPALGYAELERVYGAQATAPWSRSAALVDTEAIDVQQLGGIVKTGRVLATIPTRSWSAATRACLNAVHEWQFDRKVTLGISVYGFPTTSTREVETLGLHLKKRLRSSNSGGSVRLIPSRTPALSSATSHHNKLGLADNKIELLIVAGNNGTVIARSVGAQNITALAARDQGRPKRDAFVGMLPPKLALTMVNLAGGATSPTGRRLLDPFCGTGVLLQEALLRGYDTYGTDLAEKMIDYSKTNLSWLEKNFRITGKSTLAVGDATVARWQPPIDVVATETYLGQPFSAFPNPAKLRDVRNNCNHIVGRFLENLHSQLQRDTILCVAVPAWHDPTKTDRFVHLPLLQSLETLGYKQLTLRHTSSDQLLYYRDDQVVARELLLLIKK